MTDLANFASKSNVPTIDRRLVFLARASARYALIEAGELSLDEAFDGLVAALIDDEPAAVALGGPQ